MKLHQAGRKIVNRWLSAALAVLLLLETMPLPAFADITGTEKFMSGLTIGNEQDIKGNGVEWTITGENSIQGYAENPSSTNQWGQTSYTSSEGSITLTNTSGADAVLEISFTKVSAATLTFTHIKNDNSQSSEEYKTLGTVTTVSGVYSNASFAAGEILEIKYKTRNNVKEEYLYLTNITLTEAGEKTITFRPDPVGKSTYTVTGTQVAPEAESTPITANYGENVSIRFDSSTGENVVLGGWRVYNENGDLTGYISAGQTAVRPEGTTTFAVTQSITVEPVFVVAAANCNTAPLRAGGEYWWDWETAFAVAAKADKKVVQTYDFELPAYAWQNGMTGETPEDASGTYVTYAGTDEGEISDPVYHVPEGFTYLLPFRAGSEAIETGTVSGKLTYANYDVPTSKSDMNADVQYDGTSADDRNVLLTVPTSCTIQVDGGKLILGGRIDGNGFASICRGERSNILLNGTIRLEFGSVFSAVGYVYGAGGQVVANPGSEIYTPFVVYDYYGGGYTATAANTNNTGYPYNIYYTPKQTTESAVTPFMRYGTHSLQTMVTMHQGAYMFGYVSMYAGLDYQKCMIQLVGDTNQEALIKLNDGATLTAEYQPDTYAHTDNCSGHSGLCNYSNVGRTNMTIDGGGSMGTLKMHIAIGEYAQDVDMSVLAFPVPYNYNIKLINGSYSIPNSMLLLPGATMEVAQDATLTLGSDKDMRFMVYDGMYDQHFSTETKSMITEFNTGYQAVPFHYPLTADLQAGGMSGTAQLIVNGQLNIGDKVSFGGLIQTTGSGSVSASEGMTASCDSQIGILKSAGGSGIMKTEYYCGAVVTELPAQLMMTAGSNTMTAIVPGNKYQGTYTEGTDDHILASYTHDHYIDGYNLSSWVSGYEFTWSDIPNPLKKTLNAPVYGTWEVGDDIAKLASTGKIYLSIQNAVNAAQDGDTVIVLKNVQLTGPVTVPEGKDITIDLNGCTVENASTDKKTGGAVIVNNGTLNLTGTEGNRGTGGTLKAATMGIGYDVDSKFAATVSNYGTLSVSNITLDHAADNSAALLNCAGGTVSEIKNVVINNTNTEGQFHGICNFGTINSIDDTDITGYYGIRNRGASEDSVAVIQNIGVEGTVNFTSANVSIFANTNGKIVNIANAGSTVNLGNADASTFYGVYLSGANAEVTNVGNGGVLNIYATNGVYATVNGTGTATVQNVGNSGTVNLYCSNVGIYLMPNSLIGNIANAGATVNIGTEEAPTKYGIYVHGRDNTAKIENAGNGGTVNIHATDNGIYTNDAKAVITNIATGGKVNIDAVTRGIYVHYGSSVGMIGNGGEVIVTSDNYGITVGDNAFVDTIGGKDGVVRVNATNNNGVLISNATVDTLGADGSTVIIESGRFGIAVNTSKVDQFAAITGILGAPGSNVYVISSGAHPAVSVSGTNSSCISTIAELGSGLHAAYIGAGTAEGNQVYTVSATVARVGLVSGGDYHNTNFSNRIFSAGATKMPYAWGYGLSEETRTVSFDETTPLACFYVYQKMIPVAKVVSGTTETPYETLQEAVDAAATAGDTVVVLKDIELTQAITVAADQDITIDLNGHKLQNTSEETLTGGAVLINRGTLDLTGTNGGTLTAAAVGTGAAETTFAATVENYGTLSVDGIDLVHTGTNSAVLLNHYGATVTSVNHVTVTNSNAVSSCYGIVTFGTIEVIDNTDVTSYYGIYSKGTSSKIARIGTIGDTGTVNITYVEAGKGGGIYAGAYSEIGNIANAGATVNIGSKENKGNYGVYVNGAGAEVNNIGNGGNLTIYASYSVYVKGTSAKNAVVSNIGNAGTVNLYGGVDQGVAVYASNYAEIGNIANAGAKVNFGAADLRVKNAVYAPGTNAKITNVGNGGELTIHASNSGVTAIDSNAEITTVGNGGTVTIYSGNYAVYAKGTETATAIIHTVGKAGTLNLYGATAGINAAEHSLIGNSDGTGGIANEGAVVNVGAEDSPSKYAVYANGTNAKITNVGNGGELTIYASTYGVYVYNAAYVSAVGSGGQVKIHSSGSGVYLKTKATIGTMGDPAATDIYVEIIGVGNAILNGSGCTISSITDGVLVIGTGDDAYGINNNGTIGEISGGYFYSGAGTRDMAVEKPDAAGKYPEGMSLSQNTVPVKSLSDPSKTYNCFYIVKPHTHKYEAVVTEPTCTEAGYTTYTCTCGDHYVDDEVAAAGHNYVDGVCTVCGAGQPSQNLKEMLYDDRMDVTGKTVDIVDASKTTSYQVGYGVAAGTKDTAVVTLVEDNVTGTKTLIATGIGTAEVVIDGTTYEITVNSAPISLLLVIGQSNAEGIDGNADQSIVCPDGQVYSTYGDHTGLLTTTAKDYVASALTGAYSKVNLNGNDTLLSGHPINSLTDAGAGKIGMDSGIAYEWVKQTKEKVWIVNAAHTGRDMRYWISNGADYKQAVALFKACQEVLAKEIAAGHYTLSHMGYFWCQGCSDATRTAEAYVTDYLEMHNALKTSLAFDHDGDGDKESLEFAGIIPVHAGSSEYLGSGYRDGVCAETTYDYQKSFQTLRFTGPRVAQYWMINNPELTDIWGVCNIGEDWVYMPDGDHGVQTYFQSHYANGTVDYVTQVQQADSWYTPTTPTDVHPGIHYKQIGYNEIGREAARNTLIMLKKDKPDTQTTVEFLSWDGYTPVSEIYAQTEGKSENLVVPMVSPIWNAKNVTYSLSAGLSYNYYDLVAATEQTTGTLEAVGATGEVQVRTFNPVALVDWAEEGINDTYFEDLQTAVRAAVKDGGKVVVLTDLTLTKTITVDSGKEITIDLNGKTISNSTEITLLNSGTLTLTGPAGDMGSGGTIICGVSGSANTEAGLAAAVKNEGKLTVTNISIQDDSAITQNLFAGLLNGIKGVVTSVENVVINADQSDNCFGIYTFGAITQIEDADITANYGIQVRGSKGRVDKIGASGDVYIAGKNTGIYFNNGTIGTIGNGGNVEVLGQTGIGSGSGTVEGIYNGAVVVSTLSTKYAVDTEKVSVTFYGGSFCNVSGNRNNTIQDPDNANGKTVYADGYELSTEKKYVELMKPYNGNAGYDCYYIKPIKTMAGTVTGGETSDVEKEYASLADAIAAYQSMNAADKAKTYIVLYENTVETADITVSEDLYLDLNGKTVNLDGNTLNLGRYTLYGMDSKTNAYLTDDETPGAIIGTVSGNVASVTKATNRGANGNKTYVQVNGTEGIEFHRVAAHVTGIQLAVVPSTNEGYLSFRGTFRGDAQAAGKLTDVGFMFNDDEENTTWFGKTLAEGEEKTGTITKADQAHFYYTRKLEDINDIVKAAVLMELGDGNTCQGAGVDVNALLHNLKDAYINNDAEWTQEQKSAFAAYFTNLTAKKEG